MAHTSERTEFPLHIQSLRNRVDLARIEAYSVFAEEKSASDFYLENLLNTFVALVQYPVSFIIFSSSDSEIRPLFHFCLDKAHYSWFTDMVNNSQGEYPWGTHNTFSLFPGSLKDDFRIAVVHMHTKLRSGERRCTPIEATYIIEKLRGGTDLSDEEQRGTISSGHEYIAACSYFFFEELWYGHYSRFAAESEQPLRESIGKIHENYSGSSNIRKWPPGGAYLLKQQALAAYPNSNSHAWTDCVNESLTQFIDDSRYGLHIFNAIANTQLGTSAVDFEARKKRKFSELQPPNMIVAYRTFDRQHQNHTPLASGKLLRHLVRVHDGHEGKEEQAQYDGYSYNVRFVMPNRNSREDGTLVESDPYSTYFQLLSKLRGTKSAQQKKILPYQDVVMAQTYETETVTDRKRMETARRIAQWADAKFWTLLESDVGIEKLRDAFSQQVGRYSRSMVDPVFSTGLIHINEAYALGGLDRIQIDKCTDIENLEDLHEETQADLIRIVATYYIFAASAGWKLETPSTGSLCTMIIPIKMRGSVWGASIHAFYIPDGDYDRMFQHNNIWIANFLLATSGRQKIQNRADGILWARAQRRVLRLLMKEVGRSITPADFDRAIERVNVKLQGEQLLSPYAFPQFSWDIETEEVFGQFTVPGDESKWWRVSHRLDAGASDAAQFLVLKWQIKENPFFTARQTWSKKGTRNFLDVVDLGLKRGIELMVARSLAVEAGSYVSQ